MRTFKLTGALAVVLAFSALGAATASAAEILWKLLPGSAGETFTGSSGTIRFTGSFGTITCTAASILLADATLLEEGSTEKKDATLALAFIHFTGCATAGLAINSVGDEPKVILLHVHIHTCMLAPGHFGLLIKLYRSTSKSQASN